MTQSFKFKQLFIPALVTASLFGTAVQAGSTSYPTQHNGYTVDTAPVTQVEPIYESVRVSVPRRECRTEVVEHRSERPYRDDRHQARGRSITPEIIGAVIGAGLGHKFGRGRGKDIGTVAGAVLGASVGHDIKRHNRHHNQRRYHASHRGHDAPTRTYVEHVEVCEDVANYHEEQRVVGYRVQYRYNGRDYWTETNRDPGERIEVRVSVSPVSSS